MPRRRSAGNVAAPQSWATPACSLQASAAGRDAVVQRDRAHEAVRRHAVAHRALDHVARKLLVRGDALAVGRGEAGHDEIEPQVELALRAVADLDRSCASTASRPGSSASASTFSKPIRT